MTKQHTPGPWQVNGRDSSQVCDADGESRGCAPVALCLGRKTERTANAILIAAAPELLAALRDLTVAVQRFTTADDDSWPELRAACELLVKLGATDLPAKRPPLNVLRAAEARRQRNAMAQARRLAARIGVEIEKDADLYWVTHPAFDGDDTPDDPREGSHCCAYGSEVLEAVQDYAQALALRALRTQT